MQYQLRRLCGFGRHNDRESRETLEDAEITEHMTRNRPGNQQYFLLDDRVAMFYSPVVMRDLSYNRVVKPAVGGGTGIMACGVH